MWSESILFILRTKSVHMQFTFLIEYAFKVTVQLAYEGTVSALLEGISKLATEKQKNIYTKH